MADETATKKRKRSLEDELRDTPAGPSSPNSAFDEAINRTAAAEKLRSDVAAMPKLPVGRAPTAPARTPSKPITHGSAPAAPVAAMARADAALGGAPAPRTVQQLATDLQQTQRNHPAALGPGLRPSLAGLDPVSADVKDFINKPGRNTLTPEAFFAQQERDQAESTLHDMNPALGDPEAVARAHSARARKAGLDAATAGQDLGANREKYLANRDATQAGRQGLVMARGMTRGMEKLLAMNPHASGAAGIGGAASQQYDPVSSAGLGLTMGMMMGRPDLAAQLAGQFGEGAAHANQFQQSFNASEAARKDTGERDKQQHLERMLQGEQQLAAIKGKNDAPTDEEIIAGLLAKDPTGAAADAYTRWAAMRKGAAGATGAGPVGFVPDPEREATQKLSRGQFDQTVYDLMDKLHGRMNVLNWNPFERFASTQGQYYPAMVKKFIALFPDVPAAVVERMARQYYARRFGDVPDASLDVNQQAPAPAPGI
jgi:hypothetical protein